MIMPTLFEAQIYFHVVPLVTRKAKKKYVNIDQNVVVSTLADVAAQLMHGV